MEKPYLAILSFCFLLIKNEDKKFLQDMSWMFTEDNGKHLLL